MAPRPTARPCASSTHRRLCSRARIARGAPARRSQLAFIVLLMCVARTAAADGVAAGFEPPPLLRRPVDAAPAEAAEQPRPARAPQEQRPLIPSAARDAAHVIGEQGTSAPSDAAGVVSGSGLGTGTGTGTGTGSPTQSTSTAASLWEQLDIVPIAMVIGALATIALLLRTMAAKAWRGGGRPEGVVEILARYPAGRGQQIVLMRIGRRVIVAHQADRSMRTLTEVNDADEVAELIAKARAPGGDLFARLLDRKERELDPFAEAEMVDLTREATMKRIASNTAPTAARGLRR